MKNNNINFFESPNPRHFNFNNFHDEKYHHFQDHEIHDERLFATPVALPKAIKMSPFPIMDPFPTSPNIIHKRKDGQEQYQQHSLHEQAQFSFHGIQQKIEFSDEQQEEELLIPITPLKIQKMEEIEEAPATIRKNFAIMATPTTETKIYQRGLKKLAFQAHRFVCHQKKTTYKEVAKKLIEQLGDDGDIDVNKKGEMNIKRRVYDALNVLIALGLLRRNGNRIYSKKFHYEENSGNNTLQRQRQLQREEALQKELNQIRQTYQQRMEIINAKKNLQIQIKHKIEKFRQLQNKNIKLKNQHKMLQEKLQFPLLLVCFQQNEKKSQFKQESRYTKKVEQNQQSSLSTLSMWQTNESDLYCSYNNNNKKLSLTGQLDFLSHLRTEEPKPQPERIERLRRRR